MSKKPKNKTIKAGNIIVANGWECPNCKLINSYNRTKCSCSK